MKILAIDASTDACSAALLIDGNIRERYEIAPQLHTRLLMPMVHELLAEAGIALSAIDAFAFGHGPGSFTGLRIATGLVQGLAMGTDRPVIGISTLAALAQRAADLGKATQIAAALDARMGQVYWGVYRSDDSGYLRGITDDVLLDPDQVPTLEPGQWMAVGSGWGPYKRQLASASGLTNVTPDADARPHAADMARMAEPVFRQGGGVPAAAVQPVYLRQKVAWKTAEARK